MIEYPLAVKRICFFRVMTSVIFIFLCFYRTPPEPYVQSLPVELPTLLSIFRSLSIIPIPPFYHTPISRTDGLRRPLNVSRYFDKFVINRRFVGAAAAPSELQDRLQLMREDIPSIPMGPALPAIVHRSLLRWQGDRSLFVVTMDEAGEFRRSRVKSMEALAAMGLDAGG